jgi:hypothetical protein
MTTHFAGQVIALHPRKTSDDAFMTPTTYILKSANVIELGDDKKTVVWLGLPDQCELGRLETQRDERKRRIGEKRAHIASQKEKQQGFHSLLARKKATGPDMKRKCISMPFITIRTSKDTRWQRWERDEVVSSEEGGDDDSPKTAPYMVYDFSNEFQLYDDSSMMHDMIADGSLRIGKNGTIEET